MENSKNQEEQPNEETVKRMSEFTDKFKKDISAGTSSDKESEPVKNQSTFRPFENLTYEQALEYLKEGVAVKLPEWNGMWFPVRDKIFVFTKDNEILATPDYETFGKRNDWTTHIGPIDELPVRFVRALRVRIDTIRNHIKSDTTDNSETYLAAVAAQLGFMWLGLYLADLGAANPYPKSMDASSPQIEKHADKADSDYLITPNWKDMDETAIVKTLRAEIQTHIDMITFIGMGGHTQKAAWGVACDKLIEAKLWLGQQLNNIRLRGEQKEAQRKNREETLMEEARRAYARYGAVTDNKNFQGNPMPTFDELPENIQKAWMAASDHHHIRHGSPMGAIDGGAIGDCRTSERII